MATDTATSNGKAGTTISVPAPGDAPLIAIQQIAQETIRVPIVGESPLIVHKFSEKAKRAMLDAMQSRRSPKEPKDPQAEYEAAAYRLADGSYGFPSDAFKQATKAAARFYGKDVTMTAINQFVFVRGELGEDGRMFVKIESPEEPVMREDVVTVGRGGTDLRYRPQFWPWKATLEVVYFTSVLTRDSVLSLIDAGGLAVGVGEWRPAKNGTFGTYRIDTESEIEVVR